MTEEIAKKITQFFCNHGVIPNEKSEEYEYGFEIMLSDATILIIIGLIAGITRNLPESAAFLISFIILRRQAGGFHADSHLKCNIIFVITYLIFLMLLCFVPDDSRAEVILFEMLVSVISVFKFSPMEHPNRPATNAKRKKCRRNSLVLLLILCVLTLVFLYINKKLALSIASGICSVAIYLLAQSIKNKALKAWNRR